MFCLFKLFIHQFRFVILKQITTLKNTNDELARNMQHRKVELDTLQVRTNAEIVKHSDRAIELQRQMSALMQEKIKLENEVRILNNAASNTVTKLSNNTQTEDVNVLRREHTASVILIESLNSQVKI